LLTLFALTVNRIGDEGARALAEALKTNKTLTLIDFRCKKFVRVWRFCLIDGVAYTDNRIGDEGARALAEALKTNKTLTSIDFRGKDLCFV
jgi:Ran GTPase-activating protein (RanGAP) involved in mRNA processing and transport